MCEYQSDRESYWYLMGYRDIVCEISPFPFDYFVTNGAAEAYYAGIEDAKGDLGENDVS
jgi:hypothetical protein